MSTVGQEVMRTDFAANQAVQDMKEKFAEVFDLMTSHIVKSQEKMDTPPAIMSEDSIKGHMDVIKRGEDLQRCMSEACRLLETACMWSTKALST